MIASVGAAITAGAVDFGGGGGGERLSHGARARQIAGE